METYRRYGVTILMFRNELNLQRQKLETTLYNVGLFENPSLKELRE